MKKRLAIGVGLFVLVIIIAVAVIPSWRLVISGYLNQEKTYHGLPTAYWVNSLLTKDQEDKEADVNMETVAVLKKTGPAAVPMLIEALADEDTNKRVAAAKALGYIGKPAVPALIEALNSNDQKIQIGATRAFRVMGPEGKDGVDALHKILKDKDILVCIMDAAALGKMGKYAVPALVDALDDTRSSQIHSTVLESLKLLGPDAKDAVPALVKRYHSPTEEDPDKILELLKQLDPQEAKKLQEPVKPQKKEKEKKK